MASLMWSGGAVWIKKQILKISWGCLFKSELVHIFRKWSFICSGCTLPLACMQSASWWKVASAAALGIVEVKLPRKQTPYPSKQKGQCHEFKTHYLYSYITCVRDHSRAVDPFPGDIEVIPKPWKSLWIQGHHRALEVILVLWRSDWCHGGHPEAIKVIVDSRSS